MKEKEKFNSAFFEGLRGVVWIGNSGIKDLGNNLIAKIYPGIDGNGDAYGYWAEVVSKTAGLLTKEFFTFVEHLTLQQRKDERPDYKGPFKIQYREGTFTWFIAIPTDASVRNMVRDIDIFIEAWRIR